MNSNYTPSKSQSSEISPAYAQGFGEVSPKSGEMQWAQRESLLKVFRSSPGEKPLSKEEYRNVRQWISPQRGGLTRKAYEVFRNDPEMTEAAKTHRQSRDKELFQKQESSREILLKHLKTPPQEKNLTQEEYKGISPYLNNLRGGLNRRAFSIFRDDKEMVEAAQKHRERMVQTRASKSKELPSLKEVKENVLDQIRRKRVKSPTRGLENEPGD